MCLVSVEKYLLFLAISVLVFIASKDVFALTIHPVSSPTNTGQQLLTGTVDPGEVEVVVTLDATASSGVAAISDGLWSYLLSGYTEGENFITITATNAEHIETGFITTTIILDTLAPETALTESPPDPSSSRAGQFSFYSEEAEASFECQLDGSPYDLCSSPYRIDVSDGSHIFKVRSKDVAGNIDTTPAEYSWIVDTIAPGAPVVTGSTVTSDKKPTWSWSSGGNGSGTFRYRLDSSDLGTGATETAATSFMSAENLADGTHTLYVQERDSAGNWSTSGSFVTTVDTVAPGAPRVTGETPTNATRPSWSWSTGGGGSGSYRYKLDSNDLTNGATETTATTYAPEMNLADGSHTVYVQESDVAGNWSPSGSFSIILDTVAPILTNASFVDSTHVDVTFSEAVTGADTAASFAINNGLAIMGVSAQGGTTYRLSTGVQGVDVLYEITVSSVSDRAGNPISSSAFTAVFSRPADSNSAPNTPVLNDPPSATEVQGANALTPALIVNASTDPDGDAITYTFELSSSREFSEFVVSPRITATGATATWVVESPLMDNATYYWRVIANDGYRNSDYTPIASFFVNTANDPPADPSVSSPANDTEVGTRTPTIAVTNASDWDDDSLTYECAVATDDTFASIIAFATGIPQGNTGTTAWTVSVPLNDNARYSWRCRARDEHGAYGNWVSARFFVNTGNDVPTAPTINAPANGSEVTMLTPTLVVNNASDIDLFSGTLSYTFEIDTVNSFDSPAKQTSSLISEGAGSTSWTPSPLADNKTWYWRAKANDGKADGPWTAIASFFVSQFNDAPSAPTVANPANNGQVDSLTPQLSLNPATDPDNDRLTYEFAVYSDAGLGPATLVANGSDQQQPIWTVTPALSDNIRYYWIARAKDEHGANSRWSGVSSFIVKNTGDSNTPPTIAVTAPGLSDPVTNATIFTIRWDAADPDSAAFISLYFDTDTDGDGSSRTQIVTGISKDDPAKSYSWNTSLLSDGAYYIYAEIEDGKSKVSAYSSGPLIIDRTPPVALISNVPPVSTNATDATLSVGGTDVVGYRYRIDSGTYSDETPVATPLTVAALADGTHTVSVVGRDSIGNWQQNPTTVSWTVDTIPPTAVISGAPAAQTSDVSATMTVGGIGVVSYRYSLDGGPYSSELTSSTPIVLASLAEKGHTVAVVGKDLAGNWQAESNPATAIWIIDLKAPTAEFVSVPDAFSNSASAVLTVGGIDVVAYRYRLDDGPFSGEFPVSSPISLQNLQEGTHAVAIVGKDGAGNWQPEGSSTSAAWIVDTIAPVFLKELSLLPDGSSTNEPVQNVAGTVSDINLNGLTAQVSVDGSLGNSDITVQEDGTFSHLLELQPGENTITITAVDKAGNVTTDTRKIIVDSNSPAIVITTPADNSKTNQSTVDIKFTTGETVLPTVEIKLNGVTLSVSAEGDIFSAKAEKLVTGINTITITVTDPAGNTSTAKRTVTFDNTAPSLNITSPEQDQRININPLLVKGTVSDSLSGVTVALLLDGVEVGRPTVNNGAFEQTVNLIAGQDKMYRIAAKATDEAGNETSVQRRIVFAPPAKGDLDRNKKVELADAVIALRIAMGLQEATDDNLVYGDVAPLVDGVSRPDGRIGLGDAVVILRVVVKEITLQ